MNKGNNENRTATLSAIAISLMLALAMATVSTASAETLGADADEDEALVQCGGLTAGGAASWAGCVAGSWADTAIDAPEDFLGSFCENNENIC